MVGNTNSTILEVQGFFGLTYMVGIISPNLRSQETDKGVLDACAPPPAGPGSGRAWRGTSASFHETISRGEPLSFGTREQNHLKITVQPRVGIVQLPVSWLSFLPRKDK
jgi:hypothetical protein